MTPTRSLGLALLGQCVLLSLLACSGSNSGKAPAPPPTSRWSPKLSESLVAVGAEERTELMEIQALLQLNTAGLPGLEGGLLDPALLARNVAGTVVINRAIEYRSSDDRGQPRVYSGRMFLPPAGPGGPRPVPLVVYVHGTAMDRKAVPSYNQGEVMMGAMAAQTYGFVVAMPDLPGLGHDRSSRPHPYCHAKSLSLCVLDMVEPALASLDPAKFRWNGQLFLVGYSEGGYAALAAVKEAQTNPHYQPLAITGAACMAGPFHLSASVRSLLAPGAEPYPCPEIAAFLLNAYHDLYPTSEPLQPARVFRPALLQVHGQAIGRPDNLHGWLDGSESELAIRTKIRSRLRNDTGATLTIREMLNPGWVEAEVLAQAWPDTPVGRIIQANDLVKGWVPRTPIFLASTPIDEIVPSESTEAVRREWQRLGCTVPVRMVQLASGGPHLAHQNAWGAAMTQAFLWFQHWPQG